MKRLAVVAAVLMLLAVAIVAWLLYGSHSSVSSAFATLVPTGPIACPDDPNDLSGIEGWAPGAGKAEQVGQSNAGSISGFAGALGGESATPAPSPSGACTGLRSDVVARFGEIHDRLKLIPTDGFDPAARAAELTDLESIFEFVRDRIHTDAYPGSMRGAAGTLQARAGSPADKAILLAALLSEKQIPVRFVHADLSSSEIDSVVAAVQAPMPSPAPHDLDAAFKELGVDPNAARSDLEAFRNRTYDATDRVIAGAAAPTDTLARTLASKNHPLASDASAANAARTASLRDHWWVQAQQNGAWIDLDPTLATGKAGTHLGATPTDAPADSMPDAVQATLAVRLVATRIGNGALATTTLVERSMKLADVDAQPVVLTIGDRNTGSDKIAQSTSFTPSIGSGDSEQNGDAFSIDGLATVDLQIDVQQPGQPLRTYRRSVLDRRTADGKGIDAGWTQERTAYALTAAYNLLPLCGDLDVGFAGLREGDGFAALQGFMAYAAAGGNGKQMPPRSPENYPLQALHYFEYDTLVRRRLEQSRAGLRFVYDRPQLAIERRGFEKNGSQLYGVQQFDIVENGMIASSSNPADAIRANFTRGYVDEFAEQNMFSAPNDGGTIAVFDAAQRAGTPLDVYEGAQFGGIAIAPVKPVTIDGTARIGWWQVDPQTGNLIGRIGPGGAGQELVEYAIARANDWSTLYAMIQFYGDFFRCIAGAVEAPLAGLQGAAAEKWFQQCAGAAICSYLDGVGSGYVLGGAGFTDMEILLYNILDLSVPGSKDSWPPTGGAVCSGLFKSPLYP
jgi:hypothetical protein